MTIRTRFAPSPTGYLHIGGLRTALYAWAFARKYQGKFILRIEDTDLERSTPQSVKAILDGMQWSGLDYDEGPFYQTKRFERYQEVIQQLLESGQAYYCYCTKEELDTMRLQAQENNQAFMYDGRWRPEEGKRLPEMPEGVQPVVRFKMPKTGSCVWHDLVKGKIEIANSELDDIIIARSDGSPTYNFCVVVDDYDMNITHVIRGDDHVNNTPKQINILKALGGQLPHYAHLPMILNESGQKMSKRRDAVSVTDYDKQGILPEALLNYLARLGWGHGNDEFFNMAQFIQWFDLADISSSASRFDHEKLLWLNAQHIKHSDNESLVYWLRPRLQERGIDDVTKPPLINVVKLIKDRVQSLNDLIAESIYFYEKQTPSEEELTKHIQPDTKERMNRFALLLKELPEWNAQSIHDLFKPFCQNEGIKMGQLGMPLRILVCGTTKTPSIDVVLALLGRDETLNRLKQA